LDGTEFVISNVFKLSLLCCQLFFQWLSGVVALQTSIACHMSTHKAQEVQKSSSANTDSEHVIRKCPHSSTLDSVPMSPADTCSSSGDNNSNTFVTSSSNTAVISSNMNSGIPVLSHNNGSPARTFVMNGSLQPESAPCNKTLAVVNGPISLLKDKQACASSLTNPLQQNGEFRNNSTSSNSNHHNNNNSNVKEDTNSVSAQCQKTCAGFGGTIINHSNNNNNNNNNNNGNNNNVNNNNNNNSNNNNNNNSAGNKCVGGITNQIVTTKVVKPG
jgi:hypothetical protein